MKYMVGFFALTFWGSSLFAQEDEIDDSQDRIKVEAAVVKWADSVFYSHTNYKFENFRAEYSEGYFIAVMRERAYQEQITDFEQEKASGRYKGTQEAYEANHKAMRETHAKAKHEADNYKERADYYLVHFWSNIQTTDGITVYYEHIVKLNNNYQVVEASINSAIGKKSESTQILYKKDVNVAGEKKKSDSAQPSEIKPLNSNDTQTNSGSDTPQESVTGVTNSETVVVDTPAPEAGKKKKDKKKKK